MLEMRETSVLNLPVEKVWSALNNPDILKLCVPGCEEINLVDPTTYTAKATIKVGFISSKFNNILVKKTESVENRLLNFEMSGEDTNRIGSFKQNLRISLEGVEGDQRKTKVQIDASVDLKGKFATLGKRIVEWKAKKVTEEFLQNLSNLEKK